MVLLDGTKLTYLNASHQIEVGAGYELVINLVYPIVIYNNIVVNYSDPNITVNYSDW